MPPGSRSWCRWTTSLLSVIGKSSGFCDRGMALRVETGIVLVYLTGHCLRCLRHGLYQSCVYYPSHSIGSTSERMHVHLQLKIASFYSVCLHSIFAGTEVGTAGEGP